MLKSRTLGHILSGMALGSIVGMYNTLTELRIFSFMGVIYCIYTYITILHSRGKVMVWYAYTYPNGFSIHHIYV
ncbi:hypothetical protein BZA77DRAFT_132496 [Pyronema omphalodes]|nr:hypothetical protein BZA77DRAFT_132496 [Pyronema omphalodes]